MNFNPEQMDEFHDRVVNAGMKIVELLKNNNFSDKEIFGALQFTTCSIAHQLGFSQTDLMIVISACYASLVKIIENAKKNE